MELTKTTRAFFNAMNEGIMIIDQACRVVFANQVYLDFIGESEQEVMGRELGSIRPSARLPEVVQSGQKLVHMARSEDSASGNPVYFVNMYPIVEDGQIKGGISVVIFLDDAYDVKKALEKHEEYLQSVMDRINEVQGQTDGFDSVVAVSSPSVAAKELAQRIAATDATVLLESESGTGKEVYAKAIHNASSRRGETFLAINCASLSSALLESELFGYVGGAFTGAEKKGKMGVFEAARGGTLFLDEISEIDLEFQAKLLRALQEHCIRPVGGLAEIPVDVRVICACNADLQEYVAKGRFRKDLYYRLNTFTIHIPPLRERKEDIPHLADFFLREFSEKLKRPISLSEDAMVCMQNHSWPGNVRELRNILEFGAYLSENGIITPSMLPGEMTRSSHAGQGRPAEGKGAIREGMIGDEACSRDDASEIKEESLMKRVRRFERQEIRRTLEIYGSDLDGKKRAAKALGISLASLYNKLKET